MLCYAMLCYDLQHSLALKRWRHSPSKLWIG